MSPTNQKIYHWKGKTHLGVKLSGETSAQSVLALRQYLKQEGIISCHIHRVYSFTDFFEKSLKIFTENKKKIRMDIIFMIRQLSMLLSAHIPLVQALEVVENHENKASKILKKIIQDCQKKIRSGHTLSYAFNQYPDYFNSLFCCWIEAGERSGTLDILLEHWVSYQEKNEQLRQKIKKALIYPSFILVIAILIALVLLIGVVPIFEKLFYQFGEELPKPTQWIIMFSQFFQTIGIPILLVLILGSYILWHMRRRVSRLMYVWDKMLLKMPLIGKIIRDAAMTRFSRALSIMLLSGFSLSEALEWTAQLMSNTVLTHAVLHLKTIVISGKPLNQAMSTFAFFPPLLRQMAAVGEISGTLDKTLTQTANFYEKMVSNKLDNLSQLIEPVMMTFVGILMGGFILAMYLPIFKLGSLF